MIGMNPASNPKESRQMLTLPRKASRYGHRLSPAAVTDALAYMGLSLPVQVKWSNGTRRLGAHRFRNQMHVITLTTNQPLASRMSETLWHELTHARQLEQAIGLRDGNVSHGAIVFSAAYRKANATYGYRNNPFEVEARKVGAEMCLSHPLVRGEVAEAPVAPRPQPPVSTGTGYTGNYSVGTGHAVATERKSRLTGHTMQVIDGKLTDHGVVGGRWVLRNATTGATRRFAGKRAAKAAMSAGC